MGPFKAAFLRYLHALAAALYLLTFGFFEKNRQSLIAALVGVVRRPRPPVSQARHVSFEESGISNPAPVVLLRATAVDGNVSPLELIYLCQWLKARQPLGVFEFGTFNGRTTLNLAANTVPGAQIVTLDLPESQMEGTVHRIDEAEKLFVKEERKRVRLYQNTPYETKVRQLLGDSGSFDFTPWENQFDFIFIDASHTYDNVLHDSRTALKLLRGGKGILVWHDYNGWEGVTRAVDAFAESTGCLNRLVTIRNTSLALLKV